MVVSCQKSWGNDGKMMGKMMGKWKDCWWLRTYWKTCYKFAFATDLVIQTLAMLLLVDFFKKVTSLVRNKRTKRLHVDFHVEVS